MRTFLFISTRRIGTDQLRWYAENRGATIPILTRLVSTICVALRGTLDSLRHFIISHLVNELREPLPVVKELAGHSKIETTIKYIRVLPDHHKRAIANFKSVYANQKLHHLRYQESLGPPRPSALSLSGCLQREIWSGKRDSNSRHPRWQGNPTLGRASHLGPCLPSSLCKPT